MNNFENKTAVITGAASGIGLALARHAAAVGMNVVLADIDEAALNSAVQQLDLAAGRALAVRTDVRHAAEIKKLADAAYSQFGAVHLLFNNAGVALARTTWEHTVEDWEWILQVNLWSVVHGISEFLPRMQAQGGAAHIVNTASVAGLVSNPGMAAYNVSKHGVVTLSETLSLELQMTQSPVGISLLCPGWVPTGIGRSERNRPADVAHTQPIEGLSAQLNKRIGKAIAGGQLTADDMARETFKAIGEKRFYVIPHDYMFPFIETRMKEILTQQNPTLPK
ncbi:NADP-dependent 3-hydroxy acid dehydrogenase YdfG [Limnobacter thiooxidans]|uniref:SDR family NAD(P)-dependent oxidoreductase n=1 Tax=Limnobacter thiooxidans TaxID=131080 RepID=A0AA86MI72_9BURK|nr:SDR family NAD(P)-dependent oxidoreductase [Limnobacter sp.]MCZ8015594.1 SDR family NAD(P)-dependent oxidoreductase [Limnobacter sp.]RZS42678.1 NADP-dependent 3-hydroxy acid dehydrogenase YdfG [Limnobacter thiooxidans]BET25887.1 SDR family NAD(P)-dependent oxidoreductase [Limnobacter thiooxidans]